VTTFSLGRGRVLARRVALPAASIICLVAALLLPQSGPGHVVRIVLGLIGVTIAPSWFVACLLAPRLGVLLKFTVTTVIVAGYLATLGTLANLADVRTTAGLVAAVSIPLTILLALIVPDPLPARSELAPAVAVVLALAIATVSTIATHLLLPRTTYESSYAIDTTWTFVAHDKVLVPIDVQRVDFTSPITLTVEVNYQVLTTVPLGLRTGPINVRFTLPPSTACAGLDIVLRTADGELLNPPVSCVATLP
jgi:hypothetical protein